MAKSWYAFIGGDDKTNVTNYFKLEGTHQCLCGNEISVIYASDNGIHPKDPISPNVQKYIRDALITQQLQPQLPYGSRKYVYLRY